MLLDPTQPLSAAFREAIGDQIDRFMSVQRPMLATMGPELSLARHLAREFTAGGKRLRPAFCAWGFRAIAEEPADPTQLLRAAASLDLLHVSALIHDDVMDASDTRRGMPAAHHQFAAATEGPGAAAYGRSGAILLGDLLVMWSAEMFDECGFAPADMAKARKILAAMRTEVVCGQLLDVTAQTASPAVPGATAQATRVLEYKSARYTVVRPTQIGAALAGADAKAFESLGRFGSPLGRAFQLRDDVLGVFGDSERTGKPTGDDLREGKRTILIAQTYQGASAAQREELDRWFGRDDIDSRGIDILRQIITDTGALAHVEDQIKRGLDEALMVLDAAGFTPEGTEGLTRLALAAVQREA